ncbi:ribonuclease P [Candidatus Woesearchaeota archaeon]|nr:ribonuclease P [Candidatus Woesearchaeota archaeon]
MKDSKSSIKKIAKERINILFDEAKKIYKNNPSLADRYVAIAKKIAMKTQISIPSDFKKKFCKKCSSYLIPGLNCRVRIRNKKLIYYCLNCKNYMRFPYKS